jgi:hypothetical protein
MPQGLDHVEAALEWIERASDALDALGAMQESRKSEAGARLASAASLLRAVRDRFFLKTRVSVPFARKCEGAAQELAALLADLSVQPAAEGEDRLDAALGALESAVKTLDERSLMQGMSIT